MKTTKSMLIAIIFALSTIGMAQSEGPIEQSPDPENQSITVALKSALQNRAMVYAMRTQLNSNFLEVEKPLYSVPIKYNGRLLYITGCCKDWQKFFNNYKTEFTSSGIAKRIHLKVAVANRNVSRAMHEQLTPAILRGGEKPVYTAPVRIKNKTIYVFGTYNEWKWFFRTDNHSNPLDS